MSSTKQATPNPLSFPPFNPIIIDRSVSLLFKPPRQTTGLDDRAPLLLSSPVMDDDWNNSDVLKPCPASVAGDLHLDPLGATPRLGPDQENIIPSIKDYCVPLKQFPDLFEHSPAVMPDNMSGLAGIPEVSGSQELLGLLDLRDSLRPCQLQGDVSHIHSMQSNTDIAAISRPFPPHAVSDHIPESPVTHLSSTTSNGDSPSCLEPLILEDTVTQLPTAIEQDDTPSCLEPLIPKDTVTQLPTAIEQDDTPSCLEPLIPKDTVTQLPTAIEQDDTPSCLEPLIGACLEDTQQPSSPTKGPFHEGHVGSDLGHALIQQLPTSIEDKRVVHTVDPPVGDSATPSLAEESSPINDPTTIGHINVEPADNVKISPEPPTTRLAAARRRKATSPPPGPETPAKRQSLRRRKSLDPPKPLSEITLEGGHSPRSRLRRRSNVSARLSNPALKNVGDTEYYSCIHLEKLADYRIVFSGFRTSDRIAFSAKLDLFKEVALKYENIRVLVIDADAGAADSVPGLSSVTHVIAKDDENRFAMRTQKYIAACIYGRWIVRMDWIDACINQKRLVPEDEYEIYGNDKSPDSAQINRERVANNTPSSLHGLKMYLCPTSLGTWHEFLTTHLPVLGCTVCSLGPAVAADTPTRRRRTRSSTSVLDSYLVPHPENGTWHVHVDTKRPIVVARDDGSVVGADVSKLGHLFHVVPLSLLLHWICSPHVPIRMAAVSEADSRFIRAAYSSLLK